MTNLEAKKHLARKLNIDYADISNNDVWTDTDLQVLIQLGVLKAWDYKLWPFTKKVMKATTIDTEYYDYPQKLMLGSIYKLTVAGKEYKKIIDEDYFKYFEDYPNAADRIFTEVETFIFVNQNAYTIGDEMDQFGKQYPIALSGDSDLLPFSPSSDNYEHSGNETIVQLGYAEALDSEKLKNPAQAEIERTKAYQTLGILWKPFAEQRALLQSKGRPMFNTPDYFGGIANDKSSINNGNFTYLN